MDQDQVETSGKTVEDALNVALKQLRASVDDVEFTVLDEGKRGFFFGAGARDARVRVQRTSPAASSAPAKAPDGPPSTESAEGQSRRGGRGRGGRGERGERGREDRPRGGSRGGRGEARTSSRRSYEEPIPGLSDADFRKRAEEAGEEPSPQQDEQPRQRPAGREPRGGGRQREGSRSNDEGRQRERKRQEEPQIAPNIDHELVDVAATVVDDVLRLLEIDASINLREPLTHGDGLGSAVAVIDISGDDLGVLIGRRGDTLLNLQYLVNLIVSRRYPNEGSVTIDIEHYRHRREEQLVDLANRMADRVREGGNSITLEPMAAGDRRLVHLTLADDPDVETHSTGDGEDRKVVISSKR